jgi:PAS domain S-box-containing protein
MKVLGVNTRQGLILLRLFLWSIFSVSLITGQASANTNSKKIAPELASLSAKISQRVVLSPEEKNWLASTPKIRIRTSSISMPYSFDDANPQGLAVDYASVICNAYAVACEFVPNLGGAFKDAFVHLGNADGADVLLHARRSHEREALALFAKEYLFSPWVILTRNDSTDFYTDVKDLKGKRVLVEKGYLIGEKLSKDVPGINLLEVANTTKALEALAGGEGDAYVGSLSQVSFLIPSLGLSNIKISAPTSYPTQGEAMAVRKDWPEFVSLTNKALSAMTVEEHQLLRNRWLSIRFDYGISTNFVIGLVVVVIVLFAFILIFWNWNRRLHTEVAQRREAEVSLTRKQVMLERTESMAHLASFAWEVDTNIVTWSPEMYRIFGRDPALGIPNLEGQAELYTPESMPILFDAVGKAVSDGTPYEIELMTLQPNGEQRPCIAKGFPERNDSGRVVRVSGLVQDITERKLAEKNRREMEDQYRSLVSTMAEGVILMDENTTILAHNKSAEKIMGLSADQIEGKTTYDPRWHSIHEDGSEFPGETHPVVVTLKTGLPQKDVIMGIHKPDGELTWISINTQPIFQEGKTTPFRVVATMHDITERKRGEKEAIALRDQIVQTTKMESIGHLTAGIAHDFNNMLGAMMGYTELSQHMLAAGKADVVLRYQGEILSAGTRAKELIAQMLAFSRSSSDKEGGIAPVTLLTPIVKEVIAMLRSSIPVTVNINYRVEADDLKARIQPVHLHQILLNLGVNARDAMGEYGKIDILLSRYHSDNQLCSACKNQFSGDYARISVKDSGSGIPDAVLNKIFDPFFTTKSVGKGTGMGLSVVHGLVRSAGGHILLESSATAGTTFDILLPLADEAHSEAAVIEAAAVSIKGARILVVDDELPLATMMQEYLTSYGAQVVSFTNPMKALEAFIQNAYDYDVVITDEAMPGISGMLLAEKMLLVRPGMPIILCTGYSDHANPETVEKIGIAGFFQKPINVNELMRKIQALLYVKAG